MLIEFIPRRTLIPNRPVGTLVLQEDAWDDFSYKTLFQAYLFTHVGRIDLGDVKICCENQSGRVPLGTFVGMTRVPHLEPQFCSLGQSLEYYDKINELDLSIADEYYEAMRDCAVNKEIYERFRNYDVFKLSLLRVSTASEVLDKMHRRSVLKFEMGFSSHGYTTSDPLVFDFEPYKDLPHRINVIVGENGVGKTKILSDLAMLMSKMGAWRSDDTTESLVNDAWLSERPSFYRVIAVSFNAFDSFRIPQEKQARYFQYFYRGLRDISDDKTGLRKSSERSSSTAKAGSATTRAQKDAPLALKSQQMIIAEIGDSIANIKEDEKRRDIFCQCCRRIFPSWLYEDDEDFFRPDLYENLSAGQRICLNIISGLVELVEDGSLILLDEPENHLHPMMMSTLVNILFELLHNHYNAYAIIATHSPIVVQQVPSRFVQVIHREVFERTVYPPKIETFGADLAELTSKIFEAFENERDYTHVLKRMLEDVGSIEGVEDQFGGLLGTHAKIYLRGIFAIQRGLK